MKMIKMIKPYVLKYKLDFIIFILLGSIICSISIIFPYIVGKYLDALLYVKSKHIIYSFTITALSLWVIDIALKYFFNLLGIKLQSVVVFDLNFDVLEHVKKLPLLNFNFMNSTYLNQKINSDANTVTNFVIQSFIQVIVKLSTFIVITYLIFKINSKISIILILLIFIYTCIYYIFKSPLYKLGFKLKENQNKFFAKMNEQLYHIKVLKINCWYEVLGNKLKNSYKDLLCCILKFAKIDFLFSSSDLFISRLASLALFFYGGFEIINGRMSIGSFTIINSYFSILLECISYFLVFGKSYQDSLVSYTRITELLDIDIEQNGNKVLSNIDEIELKNVTFSYDNHRQLLNGFSYKFEKGKIYSIAGKNGSGKSTFINLLTGLLNNSYSGEICYNSININELDLYDLRKRLIGVMEQEPILFNDTIENNLTYGLNSVNKNNIKKWCKDFNMYDFIINLPKGFDSYIEEKGNNFSGGEKQRLIQIRTLLKNPELIILDEPTSALDKIGVAKLKTVFQELKEDKIIIIISHDEDVINIADEKIILCIE